VLCARKIEANVESRDEKLDERGVVLGGGQRMVIDIFFSFAVPRILPVLTTHFAENFTVGYSTILRSTIMSFGSAAPSEKLTSALTLDSEMKLSCILLRTVVPQYDLAQDLIHTVVDESIKNQKRFS
jgi:hypothetical protein